MQRECRHGQGLESEPRGDCNPPPEPSAVGGSVVAVDALPPVVVAADPVEAALTDALSRAAAAGAWTTVEARRGSPRARCGVAPAPCERPTHRIATGVQIRKLRGTA